MIKNSIQFLLIFALTNAPLLALCKHESCSDSVETLDPATLEAITFELNNPPCFERSQNPEICPALSSLEYHLNEARYSAAYIHSVYQQFEDLITPEQAKYLFSRSLEVGFLLDKLIFGLEYAKSVLTEIPNQALALDSIRVALNKSKVTHCPHCYIKIIIPAIDNALALIGEHTLSMQENQHGIIL